MANRWIVLESPIGQLLISADSEGLREIRFQDNPSRELLERVMDSRCSLMRAAADELNNYFCGRLRKFNLPLHSVGTPFQRRVWSALEDIPYGETASYGEIAKKIGRPSAARAVGSANAQNPLSIVIPCHRVIGSDGRLTGYGGGLKTKEWLLDMERAHRDGI